MKGLRESDPRVVYERELIYREAVDVVIDFIDSQGLTRRELADRLGLSEARVSRILSGRENLTLRTIADLGWALGLRFALVPVPFRDRTDTPAEKDPAAPDWVEHRRRYVAEGETAEAPPSPLE